MQIIRHPAVLPSFLMTLLAFACSSESSPANSGVPPDPGGFGGSEGLGGDPGSSGGDGSGNVGSASGGRDANGNCSDGDERTRTCGLNDRGTREQICEDGEWEGTCEDPDECEDDATQGGEECGLNDRGEMPELCVMGTWVAQECVDPDECVDDTEETQSCSGGVFRRTCTDGFWSDGPCLSTELVRASVDSAEMESNGFSSVASMSANGQFVAFRSNATNLRAGDANGVSDIFVRDLESGETTLVSVSSAGAQGNGASDNPKISGDGRYVAFESSATNLDGDDNDDTDVFLHDRNTGETVRASVGEGGAEIGADCTLSDISDDGRYVVFNTMTNGVVADDTNGRHDVFVRDMVSGTTTRVSLANDESQGNQHSERGTISADGRYVVFDSIATNLVAADGNGVRDVFLRDLMAGSTIRVSLSSAGVEGDGASDFAEISSDGAGVVFQSNATNLVVNDTNTATDIFIRILATTETMSPTIQAVAVPMVDHSSLRSPATRVSWFIIPTRRTWLQKIRTAKLMCSSLPGVTEAPRS